MQLIVRGFQIYIFFCIFHVKDINFYVNLLFDNNLVIRNFLFDNNYYKKNINKKRKNINNSNYKITSIH